MDANNDESICFKCLRKNSALEKENKELKVASQLMRKNLIAKHKQYTYKVIFVL